jgi:ligand-binding sensor domain-containing protein
MADNSGKRTFVAIAQLAGGVAIVVIALFAAGAVIGYVQENTTPEGWQIIRPPAEVSALLVAGDTVWTGGKDGVILIDRTSGTRLPLPAKAPDFNHVRAIISDSTGGIWIAHDGGLVEFRSGVWTVHAPGEGVPVRKCLSIIERRDGTLLVGSEGLIGVYDGHDWTQFSIPPGTTIASADVLFEDSSSDLWIGSGHPTLGGLYRVNGTGWQSFSIRDGLPHNSVRMIMQARDGAIWVATGFASHGGAARYSDGRWTNLTKDDGLAGESTRSVFEDQDGRLWIGSEYDGIAVSDGGAWHVIGEQDGLAGNEVKIMAQDTGGVYWLGTNHGLSRIQNLTFPR